MPMTTQEYLQLIAHFLGDLDGGENDDDAIMDRLLDAIDTSLHFAGFSLGALTAKASEQSKCDVVDTARRVFSRAYAHGQKEFLNKEASNIAREALKRAKAKAK